MLFDFISYMQWYIFIPEIIDKVSVETIKNLQGNWITVGTIGMYFQGKMDVAIIAKNIPVHSVVMYKILFSFFILGSTIGVNSRAIIIGNPSSKDILSLIILELREYAHSAFGTLKNNWEGYIASSENFSTLNAWLKIAYSVENLCSRNGI